MWLKKDVPKHFFEVDKTPIEETAFTGKLIKITPDSYEYEGVERQTMKLLFIDDTGTYYQLDSSYTGLTRSLINTLLGYIDAQKEKGITKWEMNLELSLYINKANYKQLWIKVNWERGNWRWDIEAQRAMIETITKKNGTKENDYFEYDEKLKSCFPEIQNYIWHTPDPKEDLAMTLEDYIESIDSETDTEHIKTLTKQAKDELFLTSSQNDFLDSHVTKRIEKLTNPAKSNRLPTQDISIEDIPF